MESKKPQGGGFEGVQINSTSRIKRLHNIYIAFVQFVSGPWTPQTIEEPLYVVIEAVLLLQSAMQHKWHEKKLTCLHLAMISLAS